MEFKSRGRSLSQVPYPGMSGGSEETRTNTSARVGGVSVHIRNCHLPHTRLRVLPQCQLVPLQTAKLIRTFDDVGDDKDGGGGEI